ncbi:MAG: Gmad2 immunoglobulin-like domain-containing protein [Candidatus Peribacteraceae bacterium]
MRKLSIIVSTLLLTSCIGGAASTEVILESPTPGSVVSSPLVINGSAPGTWFFEANIVAELQDQDGNVIAVKGISALGDWMTTEQVPFEGEMTFTTNVTEGMLVIRNDNPSGEPENDKSQSFPVRF